MTPTTRSRFAALACGTLLGLAYVAGNTTVSSAALPGQYVQTQTVSVSDVHPMGREESIMKVLPKGTKLDDTYVQEFTRTQQVTVTSGINVKAAVNYAVGASGEAGGAFTPLGQASANVKVTGSNNAGVTGEAGYNRTVQDTLTYSGRFNLTVKPPQEFHKGFEILLSYTGRTYKLRQRTCTPVPGGGTGNDLCGAWTDYTMEVPTGIQLRYRNLGWGAYGFSASGDAVWSSYIPDPKGVGSPVCGPLYIPQMSLDLRTNTYRFACGGSETTGKFVADVKENPRTFDIDSLTATLTTGKLSGTVTVVRDPYKPGNSVRAFTMNAAAITSKGVGTFAINNWRG